MLFLTYREPSRPLSPFYWSSVTIDASEPCKDDPTTKLITLKLSPSLLPLHDTPDASSNSTIRPIYSIYVKDSDIQVERPYTPLFGIVPTQEQQHKLSDGVRIASSKEAGEGHNATFWIKKYDHGEVGRWLHSKGKGDVLEIRGPVVTLDFEKEMQKGNFDEVVMISGGTGITPFFQLLQSVFPRARTPSGIGSPKTPFFTLLHASRSPSALPPSMISQALLDIEQLYPDRFKMRAFVDPNGALASHNALAQGLVPAHDATPNYAVSRISKSTIEDALIERAIIPPRKPLSRWPAWLYPAWNPILRSAVELEERDDRENKKVLILVCGPESMVRAIAGPRPTTRAELRNTGILGELGFGSETIRRL